MITLYGFGPIWGLPDISVFVMKTDLYLRMAKIPYTYETYPFFGLGGAPKGKLPFIEDGGARIADAAFIIDHLRRTRGDILDRALSPSEKAVAHALGRMMEENLYWVIVQLRWRIDDNWEAFMAEIFEDWRNDETLADVLPRVRQSVLGQMWGHGIGRHTIDDVWHIGKKDVSALADVLGTKPFLMGDHPTSVDATAYAMLAQLQAGLPSPVRDHIKRHDNLIQYGARMKALYYDNAGNTAGKRSYAA